MECEGHKSRAFGGNQTQSVLLTLLDGHDQLNSVKGISTKVINERGLRNNLVGIDSELLDDDILHLSFELGAHEKSGIGASHERRGRGESGGAGDKGKGDDGLEHG